jgi:hypothetical protein
MRMYDPGSAQPPIELDDEVMSLRKGLYLLVSLCRHRNCSVS